MKRERYVLLVFVIRVIISDNLIGVGLGEIKGREIGNSKYK